MAKKGKKKKGKRVSYELIPPKGDYASIHKLCDDLVCQHHSDIADARIALAWCTSWRRDVDGHQKLGQCKKASDLDRELMDFDFVILLSKDFWTDPATSDKQRAALLDHELCHAAVKLDNESGEPLEDDRGRTVYRIRRHDLEEFSEVAERHGLWKRDLQHFAQAMKRSKQQDLTFDDAANAGDDVKQPRAH